MAIEGVLRYLENKVGVGKEDLQKLRNRPGGEYFLQKMPVMQKCKVKAKVASNVYCTAELAEKQVLVFSLMPFVFLADESTGKPCGRAIQNIAAVMPQIWGMIVGGMAPEEIKMKVGCADPGIDGGGLGHVEFNLTVEAS